MKHTQPRCGSRQPGRTASEPVRCCSTQRDSATRQLCGRSCASDQGTTKTTKPASPSSLCPGLLWVVPHSVSAPQYLRVPESTNPTARNQNRIPAIALLLHCHRSPLPPPVYSYLRTSHARRTKIVATLGRPPTALILERGSARGIDVARQLLARHRRRTHRASRGSANPRIASAQVRCVSWPTCRARRCG